MTEEKITLEDLEGMSDQEAADLPQEIKADLMKQGGKSRGGNKRQRMIDLSAKLGLPGYAKEKQDLADEDDEPWWQGEGGDLQGVPNALVSTPQQIFVGQGQGMSVPQSTSAMIIIALVIASLSLVCCQPLAIIPLIMGAVKMSETSNYQNHPDKTLAIVTVVMSVLSLVFILLQLVVGIAMEF